MLQHFSGDRTAARWPGIERRVWLVLLFTATAVAIVAGAGAPHSTHANLAHEYPNAEIAFAPRIVQLTVEKARLEAEREGAAELKFPPGLSTRDPMMAALATRERQLFTIRHAALERQQTLLGLRIAQVRHEVDGLLEQQRAREREVELFRQELRLIDDMHSRQLANVARLMSLRRDLARAEGDVGGFKAQVSRARAQIEEIELLVIDAKQRFVTDVQKEIRVIEARIDEMSICRLRDEEQPPSSAGVNARRWAGPGSQMGN